MSDEKNRIRDAYAKGEWDIIVELSKKSNIKMPETPDLEILIMILEAMGHKHLGEQLKKLPPDMARKMLENNSAQEIISMCSVDKYYRDTICNEAFWETISKKKYGLSRRVFSYRSIKYISSWRQAFYYISRPVENIPQDLLGKVIVRYKKSDKRQDRYWDFIEIIGWKRSWDELGREEILLYGPRLQPIYVSKFFRDNEGNLILSRVKIGGIYINLPLIPMELKKHYKIFTLKFDGGRPYFIHQMKYGGKEWYRLVEENEYTKVWQKPMIPKSIINTNRGRGNKLRNRQD